MDPFSIAALVAAIAGAGMQYKAQQDASKRQRDEIARSLQAQRELQMQAEQKALSTAQTYETPKRQQEQQEIAQEIEQSLVRPVAESQAIRNQQTTTQGDVSQDYTTAKAKAELETMKQAEGLARLLGKTTSAGRLRMHEGIRLMDAGMDVDRLNNFSRGQHGADQIAIQQAGQTDPGKMFLGSVLQSLGTAGLAYGGSTSGAAKAVGKQYGTAASFAGGAPMQGASLSPFQVSGGVGFGRPSGFVAALGGI